MHCCLWFRSVFRVRGPWLKRYGYHLSINNNREKYVNGNWSQNNFNLCRSHKVRLMSRIAGNFQGCKF